MSPTANQHDAFDAVELALAEYEQLFGHPLVAECPVDPDTGELEPVVTIVTDNSRAVPVVPVRGVHRGAPRASPRTHPRPVPRGRKARAIAASPTLKYERLFLAEIDDAVMLAERAEDYRREYNTVRPHEALAWNRPQEVHLGLADPSTPTFQTREILPTT